MAQITLFMNFDGVRNIEGIDYYQFVCWCLTDDFLPTFGTAGAQRIVEAVLPDASLLQYFPSTIAQGETVGTGWSGGWQAPVDLYLLGANLQGGLGLESNFFDKSKYLISIVHVVYTEYDLHSGGIALFPEWNLPTVETHIQFPVPGGWVAYLEKSMGFDWRTVARRRTDTFYCELYPCMAWMFSGCTAEEAHVFGHYWAGDMYEGPNVAYHGKRFYAFSSYQVREDWIYDWVRPDWPLLRWYSPTGSSYLQVWLSFSGGLFLPPGVFGPGGGRRGSPPWLFSVSGGEAGLSLAPKPIAPGTNILFVYGDSLTVDGEPLEVIG